jgi:hypothetical protein
VTHENKFKIPRSFSDFKGLVTVSSSGRGIRLKAKSLFGKKRKKNIRREKC